MEVDDHDQVGHFHRKSLHLDLEIHDVIELPDELRKEIHDSLKPQLETWSKTELIPTVVYGIRVYKKRVCFDFSQR